MTDRILSDVEVDHLEKNVKATRNIGGGNRAAHRNLLRLVASHRLLAARVKELEAPPLKTLEVT